MPNFKLSNGNNSILVYNTDKNLMYYLSKDERLAAVTGASERAEMPSDFEEETDLGLEVVSILNNINERCEGLVAESLVEGGGCVKKHVMQESEATLADIKRLKEIILVEDP